MTTLPPYRPEIYAIWNRCRNSILSHWRENSGAYHRKLLLTPQQAQDLLDALRYGQYGSPDSSPPSLADFMGRPIDVSDSTVGVIVAHDGTEAPLSEFDQPRPLPPKAAA